MYEHYEIRFRNVNCVHLKMVRLNLLKMGIGPMLFAHCIYQKLHLWMLQLWSQ